MDGLPPVLAEDLEKQGRVVAHHSAHPSRKKALHVGAIVDGPYMDRQLDALRGRQQIDAPASQLEHPPTHPTGDL
jgi:hypothetical protein